MKYLPFQCPYEHISCPYVDTSSSTLLQDCNKCEHYHNGVKSTGEMPIIESIFKFFKSHFSKKPKSVIKNILDETPLETKVKVLCEMEMVNMVTKMGYREKGYWRPNEQPQLEILLDTAESLSKKIMEEIK